VEFVEASAKEFCSFPSAGMGGICNRIAPSTNRHICLG
jgi:hypothetical protein